MSNDQDFNMVADEQGGNEEERVHAQSQSTDAASRHETLLEHIGRSARENPASAALIAGGLAWIIFGGARSVVRGTGLGATVGDAARSAANTASQAARAMGDAVASGAETAQDAVSRAGRTVARSVRAGVGAADQAVDDGTDAVSRETSRAGGYVASAARRTSSALSQAGREVAGTLRGSAAAVQRGGEQARRTVGDLAQNQPVLLSVASLAVGAGAAVLIPRSRVESELLGDYREEAVRAARKGAASLVSGGVKMARAKTSGAVQEAARKAAEEAAERVLRQADNIGAAILSSVNRVTGADVEAGEGEKPSRDESSGTPPT